MASNAADLILLSGKLWDGKELRGRQAIAVGAGRILATGTNREAQKHQSDLTKLIDVGGRTVMPGMIDSHIHAVRAGLRWNSDVRWDGLSSRTDALALIARAADGRDPDQWIAVVGGWNPHQFTESRPLSRRDLDEAAPKHPVFIQRNYIEAMLNTPALETLGWSGSGAPDWVESDPDTGVPTGRVSGVVALQQLKERLTTPGFEEQVEGTRAMLRELNRFGLTGAIDAGGFGMDPEAYRPIAELYQRGEQGFRTRLLVGASRPGTETSQLEEWMRLVSPGSGDEYLRYLGAGEILLLDAHDMEGLKPRDITGQITRLAEVSSRLIEAGWPVHIHAILDDSISSVLDAWEQTGRLSDLAELRYTITHADQIGHDNLMRARDSGVGVTIQNGMAFRGGDSISTWGEDRVRRSPPLRSMLDLGIPLGAGTDGTVVCPFNPWVCIEWMVSGESVDGSPSRVEEQRLSRDEALRLYTSGSAWFSFEEASRGNLEAGSHADIVVLSGDPLTVPVHEISRIESVLTMVGGEVVHSAPWL